MAVSIFLISLVIEILAGMVANGFIVLMNYIDRFRSRKRSPSDQILTCLSLSRLAWLAIMILNKRTHLLHVGIHLCPYMNLAISVVWIFTQSTNVWFATWLSVFYLAKIATFSHPVFLQVKQRISRLVPWLLLGSVVYSAMVAIVIVTSVDDGFSFCDSNQPRPNITDSESKGPDMYMYIDILPIVPNLVPLMIFLSSSLLLMTSLWRHTRRMQRNGMGDKDLNTQVHLTAIKALASFAVLGLSSFIAITVQAILTRRGMDDTWQFMLFSNVTVAYPLGHSIILILVTPRLKQAWVRMLCHLKCCSSEVPS
ncbi:taste receptor type 2 member 8-like [Paroedura picta]|uniref:taste receptor type 2 member 8-like n=1 Tax=Paroedura picta TaxID=143630 RepID=UPI0040579963